MKIVNIHQGTPEWHAYRASHFNASDAAAMLGVSPYRTREDLLREKATGIAPEVDQATQRRFDDGHRFEALARPLAEAIVGQDLFPCVGEDGRYSASFDGITIDGDTVFEHKTLNAKLHALDWADDGSHLPEHYRVQMEHQLMVSGGRRVLFMASAWDGDDMIEERHCWYLSDPALRARIEQGWLQFEQDLAQWVPREIALRPVGASPEHLPALRVEVTGMVTASNLAEFRTHAMTVLGSINRELRTDDDFADAEQTVKWCRVVEDRLDAAKAHVLAQMADVDAVFRTIDEVSEETRRIRLELDRLVKTEKDNRRMAIVSAGVDAVRAHYAAINATLGEHAIAVPSSLAYTIGEAIKGKKTLASIHSAVDTAVAKAKIEASQQAERIRANIAVLDGYRDHAYLFADRVQLCATKSPDDLRNLAEARIAAERERKEAEAARPKDVPAQTDAGVATAGIAPAAQAGDAYRLVSLAQINAAIAPLTITAEGLASIGFKPTSTSKSAKLYRASELSRMKHALIAAVSNIEAAGAEEKAA